MSSKPKKLVKDKPVLSEEPKAKKAKSESESEHSSSSDSDSDSDEECERCEYKDGRKILCDEHYDLEGIENDLRNIYDYWEIETKFSAFVIKFTKLLSEEDLFSTERWSDYGEEEFQLLALELLKVAEKHFPEAKEQEAKAHEAKEQEKKQDKAKVLAEFIDDVQDEHSDLQFNDDDSSIEALQDYNYKRDLLINKLIGFLKNDVTLFLK